MRMRSAALAALMSLLVVAVPVSGQVEPETRTGPVFLLGGLSGQYARAVGEFRENVRDGFGLNLAVIWPVVSTGPFALRADGGFLIYGSESRRVCLGGGVGCRIELDLTTTNSIAYLNVGPQLMVQGGPVRPYANAGVGFAYFGTRSEVRGSSGQEHPFASTTNFDDATFQWVGGGGVLVPLSSGRTPVLLDIGARYHGNGRVEYLREGDIQDNPDGTISFTPRRSDANLVTYQIGVVIGARRAER